MNGYMRNILCIAFFWVISAFAYAAEDSGYLHDAQQYFANKDFGSAIIQLKNTLQARPDDKDARILLARVYLEQGEGDQAEKELETALSLGAEESGVLPLLGKAWLLQGKPSEVLAKIPLSKEGTRAQQAELLCLHGRALFMRGDRAEAEARFADALALYPDHVDTLIGQARLMFSQGNREGAEERIQRALDLQPDNIETLVLSGELKRLSGELDSALARFERAISLWPDNLVARLGRASTYASLGKQDLADLDIDYILKRTPKHPIANYLKGLVLYQKGQLTDAVAALQQSLSMSPDYEQAQLLLGTIYYQTKQFNQSAYYLDFYVRKHPGNIPVDKLYAASLMRNGQADKAIPVLESAAAKASDDPQVMALLGSAYLAQSDSSRGLEYLQKAAELAPNVAAIQTQLAVGHLLAGDSKQAADGLQQAIDLGQGLVQADVLLVMTYMKDHLFDKAVSSAVALAEKLPDSPVPKNLLGVIYLQKHENENARDAFEQAIKIKPDFYPAMINLARMDITDGHPDKARARFQAILSQDKGNLDAMFGLAEMAQADGDRETMVLWLERARSAHPEALRPALLLADYYLKSDMPLKALDVTREIAEQMPDDPGAIRMLGLAQMATNSNAAAVSTMQRLVELLPANAEVRYLLATAAMKNEDSELAKSVLQKTLELQGNHLGAMYNLGNIYLHEKDYEKAAYYADQLKKNHGTQSWGYVLASAVLAAKGESAAAAEEARQAYAREPSQQLLLQAHTLMERAGSSQDAQDLLESWLTENPDDVTVHLVAAVALQTHDKYAAAITHYEKILGIDPSNVIALNNLAWLYLDRDPAMAVRYAEQAYQLNPDKPEVLDTYGWILVQGGEVQKGLHFLQEALVKAPHQVEIRYHTAVALYKDGRNREARLELEQVLRSRESFEQRPAAQALFEELKD